MEDAITDLSSDYQSHDKYNEGKDYIEENLWEKVEKVGKKLSFTKDIKALYNYFLDSSIPWYRKSIVVGALVYFIFPIDSIPDIAPLIGYLDDLGVITAVIKYLGSELTQYYD
ncbi:MAG: DUF1232 domain-containing protein [Ignavibacteriae bacterium]|nr:DUF1232 domain-containing protein [Ignavibacteriota bacterium]MCB9209503.1 DUF1232 domain-containing protein [Ignavibacteriales bacterium]MCB9258146.1 DUF1232 domain-containing protein [Ignavibacteriales bacterium]